MAMDATNARTQRVHSSQPMPVVSNSKSSIPSSTQLNGCLTFLSDGQVMLKAVPSAKTYRVEGILFSENTNHLVIVPDTPSYSTAIKRAKNNEDEDVDGDHKHGKTSRP